MSFIFSRAAVEASLRVKCWDVDAYAPLNLIPTAKRSSFLGKTTEPFLRSRFGMMFEPLTESLGKELLTSWLEGFRVKTSAQLGKAVGLTESEADYGQRWRGSFAKYSRSESKWKTAQYSLLADSDEFSETWPRWGLMRNGESYLRQIPALHIFESAFGSVPNCETFFHTPNCNGLNGGSNSRSALRKRLETWPTPTVCGNYNRLCASATSGMGLASAVKMWPTPCASASKGSSPAALVRKTGKSRAADRIDHAVMASEGGQLNPEWVEWLMGWPIGHTALEPLATGKYLEWLQQHGKF